MQLAITTLLTWITICVLALMPKKLTEIEMVALFFLDSIFSISIFTVVELNLHYIVVSNHMDRTFAVLISHIVQVPVTMLIVSNVVLYSPRFRWLLLGVIWFALIIGQQLSRWMGLITFKHWNLLYGASEFAIFIGISILTTWFIKRSSRQEVVEP